MRRNMYRKQSSIQFENHHPGCMWGALHMLDYLAWRQVRKMLPYKRHGARHHDEENSRNINQGQTAVQEDDNSAVKERMAESAHSGGPSDAPRQSTKGSMRARLKSRIVEDILRRKVKHHRSSTYPIPSKSDTIIELNVAGKDSNHLSEQDVSASLTSDPLPLASDNEAKVEWVTFGDTSTESDHQKELVSSSSSEMLIQESLENAKQALLEQKLTSAKDHNSAAPLHRSKEFLDALDLVNLDKELLQGILQEQGSSHPFQTQHSFKMCASSSVPGPDSTSPKKVEQTSDESATRNSQGATFVIVDSENAVLPSSKNKEKSQVAIRHFKILKNRLRHAIKESQKDNRRVTLDGVLHRIPYGHKLSADVKEITSYWKERAAYRDKKDAAATRSCGSSPIHKKSKVSHFRRTSSMGDSMEKYCWLYDSSFKKKPDQLASENSKEMNKEEQTKKSLGRILSMPDLKSYYYIPTEYLNDTSASRSPIRTSVDSKSAAISRSSSFAFEQQNDRKFPSAVSSPGGDELGEPLANGMTIEELNLKADIAADAVSNTLAASGTCDEEPDTDQDFEFSFPQSLANAVDLCTSDKNLPPTVELQQQDEVDSAQIYVPDHQDQEVYLLQVDSKDDIAELKYVKNVLDLAGLSRNHPHESWHASDQPVDPAVFDEVEGFDDGSGDSSYTQLVLFDLINEVLIDMYEKSFSYCPVPLSSLCRLRSMPTGDGVVNEVWSNISFYFSSIPAPDDSLDYIVGCDLAKSSGWMNLQFDTECVGLELEDMIFDDLLDEVVPNPY